MKQTYLVLVLLSLAACGGDDGFPAEDFVACGGDITGNWNFTSADATGDAALGDITGCAEATGRVTSVNQTGPISFASDMSYSDRTSVDVRVAVTIPSSCFDGGGPTSCEALGGSEDGITASCRGNIAENCQCDFRVEDDNQEMGVWMTSGNNLTLTVLGDVPEVSEYCVDGDLLTVRLADPVTGLTLVLAAERQ